MSLDKENMKKICLLIVFTLAVFVGLWRLEAVIGAITFLGGILAPFILGGAIASVSYTHLDVYKRQGEIRVSALLPILSRLRGTPSKCKNLLFFCPQHTTVCIFCQRVQVYFFPKQKRL